MPPGQTLPAAGGGGVLGDECRVSAIRCLFAIVRDVGGRQALGDEVAGVLLDGVEAFFSDVVEVLCFQNEPGSELRAGEAVLEFVPALVGQG